MHASNLQQAAGLTGGIYFVENEVPALFGDVSLPTHSI